MDCRVQDHSLLPTLGKTACWAYRASTRVLSTRQPGLQAGSAHNAQTRQVSSDTTMQTSSFSKKAGANASHSNRKSDPDFLYYCYTDQVPYGEFSNWWLSEMTDTHGISYKSTGANAADIWTAI